VPSTPAPRLRSAARDEVRTWSLSLDRMLPPDHPARAAWAFAEGTDLSPLYAGMKAVEGHPGHPHIDPRLLFALWLYATLDGVGSAPRAGPAVRRPRRLPVAVRRRLRELPHSRRRPPLGRLGVVIRLGQ
jgi:hypothetical protein